VQQQATPRSFPIIGGLEARRAAVRACDGRSSGSKFPVTDARFLHSSAERIRRPAPAQQEEDSATLRREQAGAQTRAAGDSENPPLHAGV